MQTKLYELMPYPVIIYDPETLQILDVNGAAINLYRYPVEEFLHKTLKDIASREEIENLKSMGSSLPPGCGFSGEWEHRNRWGEIINVEINNAPVKTDGLNARVLFINNVTERKKTTEALYRSERKYRSIFNDAPIGISNVNGDGIYINLNQNFADMLGYSRNEVIGTSMLEHTYYEDRNFDKDNLNDLINGTRKFIKLEKRYLRKSGLPFWASVTVSAVLDEDGKFLYTISMIEDISERIAQETALRESEEKYRNLADSLPQIIFETDKEGRLVYVNSQGAEAMGYTRDQVENNPAVINFIHPEDREKALTNISRILNGAVSKGEEYRLLRRDGKCIECIIYSSPVRKGSSVEGLRGIIVDVSERKKMERAIKDSETRYRLLFERNHAGVFESSVDGRILECNRTFAEMFGYTSCEELKNDGELEPELGRILKDTISAPDPRRNEVDNIELCLKKKNDGDIWVLGNIGLINNGRQCIQGTLIDITARKKAEEHALILAGALTEISDSVILIDKEWKIFFVNDAFSEHYGYSSDEIIGKRAEVLNSAANSKELIEKLVEETNKGGWAGELVNRKKNGSEFPAYVSTSKIIDEASGRLTYIAVSRDITRQKETEAILRIAKEKAEEMNNLKSIFLANMSHELRTPMIGILGYAGMITEDSRNPEIKQMAQSILKSANRLTETLNLILDLSKVEANRLDLKLHKVCMPHIIEENISRYKSAAAEKGISLNFHCSSDSISAMLDERLFSQVMGNLINNAVKYTSEGRVDVELNKEDDSAVVKVIDTGIGIHENSLRLIFEPFRQASEGYNRKFEGTGLGLTITRKFTELMAGSIEVESELNKGSVFTLRFPYVEGTEEIQMVQDIHSGNLRHRTKKRDSVLLLVEDEKVNADVIILFLRDYCRVEHSLSGVDAINMAKEIKYDAILMDINLKGVSGLDAVREIRKIEHHKSTPIVAVTAYAMAGDRKRFLQSGCSHYLPKPFSKQELVELLEEVLA